MSPRRNEFEGGWHKDADQAHETIADAYRGLTELGTQHVPIPEQRGGLGLSNQALNAMKEETHVPTLGLRLRWGRSTGWSACWVRPEIRISWNNWCRRSR
jgi:alkylation response protein AidB-like acyl-CoA dehydrogenase